jgi:hypothetical protein
MADRVSQAQQMLMILAGELCNSVGVIHTEHERYSSAESGAITKQIEQHVEMFAEAFGTINANLDNLFDSLPTLADTSQLQAQKMAQFGQENAAAVTALAAQVQQADARLAEIQAALVQISTDHYSIKSSHCSPSSTKAKALGAGAEAAMDTA